jgi:Probable transposase./Helix-turn-helix domain.
LIRSFKYPLHPNAEQERKLLHWLWMLSGLYNGALQERRDAYKIAGKTVTRIDQQKQLTQIREADQEWEAIPVAVARSVFAKLERAYDAFFRRVKRGEKPGFPRFKSWRRYDSFELAQGAEIVVDKNRILIPKFGYIK